MEEIWLQSNRRALWFGAILPLCLVALGVWFSLGAMGYEAVWLKWLGAGLVVTGMLSIGAIVVHLRQPRVAYEKGEVLFFLRYGDPIRVPVAVVEAFFLGQGPLALPGNPRHGDTTVNLVARLSQRAPEWAERQVKPALGRWCEGYVTIRGTWCEPLTGEVIRRLNRRLREVSEASN